MAKRILWLTDLHLDFLLPDQRREFWGGVFLAAPDAVLIGGDTSDAHDVVQQLEYAENALQCPIYFVLGNHDYYHGSVAQVQRWISLLSKGSNHLKWLDEAGVIEMGPDTALIGHGAWADGRLGDYANSPVMLNDYLLIEELSRISRFELLARLHALGDAAADHFRRVLPQALDAYARVYVLTHAPPFKEACWHEGQLSNDDFLPHFTCKAVGDVLHDTMRTRPDRHLTVLCGHTHGAGQAQILDNLTVLTGAAEYGQPAIQRVFEIE
jgi:3',5'-cyclic-AMP phosphodiesterase